MKTQPELSIVLSLRNEELVLPELISRLQKVLASAEVSYELLFVNDASNDGTADLLEDYARQSPAIKIIHLSRRFGVQASILAGIQHACGETVVMMDADLQDPPELIPQMLDKWRAGAEIVHMVRSHRDGESRIKLALTSLAYQFISRFSDVPIPVEAGDFKLLSRRAISELLRHPDQSPYLRGMIASLGFKQVSILYRREKRYAGTSHFALFGRGPVETFLSAVTSFSPVPLYSIFIAGVCMLLVSVFVFAVLLPLSFFGVWNPAVWIGNFLFLLLSLNLSSVGLLGLYLWNILKQTQNRPLYIVDRKTNFE